MRELTAQQAIEIVPAGALLLTHNMASELTKPITFEESQSTGMVASWGHAMSLHRDGMVSSQETRRKLVPLTAWDGAIIRAWYHLEPQPELYERVLEELDLLEGTRYDYLGIFAQWLAPKLGWIPLLGDALATRIKENLDASWGNYCSEGECEGRRKAGWSGFGGSGGCQLSPEDLNSWCMRVMAAQGLTRLTYRQIAAPAPAA